MRSSALRFIRRQLVNPLLIARALRARKHSTCGQAVSNVDKIPRMVPMMRFHIRSFSTVALVVFLGLAWSVPCMAADWYVSPRLNIEEEYDNNINISDDKEDDFITRIKPMIRGAYRTQRSEVSLTSFAEYEKFATNSKEDGLKHDHNLILEYAVSSRFNIRMGGVFREDRTLETELTEEGRLANRQNRRRFGGNVGMDYVFSPVFLVSVDYRRSYTQFPGDDTDLVDDVGDVISVSPRYTWSPKLNVSLNLNYSRTKYDDQEFEQYTILDRSIENYSIMPSAVYQFSERFQVSGGIGYRHTTTKQKTRAVPPFNLIIPDQTVDEGSDGFVMNFLLHRDWSRSYLEFGASRDQYSTLDGRSIERDRVFARSMYRMSPRLTAYGTIDFFRSTADKDEGDSTYFTFTPSLNYRLTRTFMLKGFVRYTLYDSDTVDTDRLQGGLSLVMEWERLFSGN